MDTDGIDVNIKVYFLDEESNVLEVHRLEINISDNTSSIRTLKSKLVEVFPQIESKEYVMFWIDDENDNVVFTNDEEFNIALKNHLSRLLPIQKIFVKLKDGTQGSKRDPSKSLHYGIECDECNGPLKGYRYKCLECRNYDLCEQCERKHMHSSHFMIRIPNGNETRNMFLLKKYHCPFTHSEKPKDSKKKHESSHSHSEEYSGSRKRKHFKCKHHGDKCDHQIEQKIGIANDILCDVFNCVSEIVQKCSNGFNKGENERSGRNSDSKKTFNVECLKNLGINVSALIDPLGLLKSSSNNTEKGKAGENENGEPSCSTSKDETKESVQRNNNFEEKVQEIGETLTKQSVSGSNDKNDWFFVSNSPASPDISPNPISLDNSKDKSSEENTQKQNSKDTSNDKQNKTTDLKFHPDPLIAQAMEYMRTMGFHNVEQLIPILELKRGDICEVLDFLLTSKKGYSSSSK